MGSLARPHFLLPTDVCSLFVDRGMFLEFAWYSKSNFLRHPLGLAAALASAPQSHRLISVPNHPAMPRLVLVDLRIGIGKAGQVPKHVDFLRLAGEKGPVFVVDAVHLRIFLELGRGVLF